MVAAMADSPRTEAIKRKAADQYAHLEQSRKLGPLVAIGRRFVEIEGGVFGGLLAIEFFTTVLPLVIIGYSYFSGFANNASVGVVIGRQLGLDSESTEFVRSAFGTSSSLRSTWSIVGVLGFLVWGIPMALTIASMFAKAWRREQFSMGARLWRGIVWFLLYLLVLVIRERIFNVGHVGRPTRMSLFALALIPTWAFWSLSPVILVRDGGRGRKFLLQAGLAGAIIDGLILGIAIRIVFPILLDGWKQFGPIGVSMTLMTWAGVIGVAWVLSACAGAIVWERNAPSATVIEAQTAVPDLPEDQPQPA